MTDRASEILINATRVSSATEADIYEFVLNDSMYVIECVRVESLAEGVIYPVNNYLGQLQNTLFELNHVRVNPKVDNTHIIQILTEELMRIGVEVMNPPTKESMTMCYRPLGEITENVRFHFNESGKCTFLCPNAKLKIVNEPLVHNITKFNSRPE